MNQETHITQLTHINSYLVRFLSQEPSLQLIITLNETMIHSLENHTEEFNDNDHTIMVNSLTQTEQHLQDQVDIYEDDDDVENRDRCLNRKSEINNLLIKLDLMLGDAMNT